jgi:hypothetical protein
VSLTPKPAACRLRHITSLRGELTGTVEPMLAREGAKRFVFMAPPHFLGVPSLLHGFRAVAATPRRLTEPCREAKGLTISPRPVAIEVSTSRCDGMRGRTPIRHIVGFEIWHEKPGA